jgi:hypothetical protein
MALGQVCLLVLRVFPVDISSSLLYTVFICMLLVQKEKRTKPGKFPKRNALSDIGECCIETHFHLVFQKIGSARRLIS